MIVKQILFFCYGDARSASTWSNVPYCFVKALEKRGISVECVDIKPDVRIDRIWNSTVKHFINFLWRNNDYYFERSWLAERISYHKIKKAVRGNAKADLCIFTSFSYWNKFDSRPSLLLCDWTYKMLINEHYHRQPFLIEKRYINQEKSAIENSKVVFSLFKSSADTMRVLYPTSNICWQGKNVINNLYCGRVDSSLIDHKKKSNVILFIGKPKYLFGARMLSDAMRILWESHPQLELHCIGITKEELACDDLRIKCYGYLKKDNPSQCENFYNLLKRARVFCNPTPEWAGYSSTIEAMFFYTPTVVSKYDTFVDEFGQDIDFGRYNSVPECEQLANDLLFIINHPGYEQLCLSAHDRVKEYTWDNFVSTLLSSL